MDRRTARTRKALVEAVRQQLLSHPWDKVSVQLICDTADTSRSTFYGHFDSKDDALAHAFDALRIGLAAPVAGRGLDEHGTLQFLPLLADHMRGHLVLFERNRTFPSGAKIYAQFRAVIDERARAEIAASRYATTTDAEDATFVVGGGFALLESWCETDCSDPIDDVVARLDRLASSVLAT